MVTKILTGLILSAVFHLGSSLTLAQCTTANFRASIEVQAGTSPGDIASGDFNADGRTDFAVTNFASDEVQIVLGNATGGPTVTKLTGVGEPESVGVGDFNKDGKLDLAVSRDTFGSVGVSIFLGNGTGGFGAPTHFPANNDEPLVVADFNNDGNIDVFLGASNGGVSQLLLGNGMGGLSGPSSLALPAHVEALAVDFNKDGKLDLALATEGPFARVALGNGLGGFGAAISLPIGSGWARYIGAGDFNSDNNLDLVAVGQTDGMSVFFGDGAGNFGSATSTSFGFEALTVAVADFSGDGKPDVAVTGHQTGTVAILVGNGGGGFSAPNVFRTATTSNSPIQIATGDFDGDSKLDFATVNSSVLLATASIQFGDGTGKLRTATALQLGSSPYAIASGDVNNDGHDDLAVANISHNTVFILKNDGNGGFLPPSTFAVGDQPRAVALGDLNDDQKLDLVTANWDDRTVSVLLGDGQGGFGPANHIAVPGFNPQVVVIGDLNNDGKQDLAVGYGSASTVSILHGTGTGTFSAPVSFPVSSSSSDIAIGDLNRDGLPDLVVGTLGISVLLGNTTTGFNPAITVQANTPASAVVIDDFNGDGKADIAASRSNPDVVNVFLGDGLGGFSLPTTFATDSGSISMAAADFNGDGNVDLATLHGLSTVTVLVNNGLGAFPNKVIYQAAGVPPTRNITIGDFNSDDRPDIAIAEQSGNVSVIFNSCSATPVPVPAASIGNVAVDEGDSGTINATFNVNLSFAGTKTVVVPFYTAARDTQRDVDYQTRVGVLTFAPGVTAQTITVPVNGDLLDEFDEQFEVRLVYPLNATINVGRGLGTITDNDPPPTISISDVTVTEGDTGITSAVFTVSLSAASGKPISISVATAADSAHSGVDFQTLAQTLNFAAGQTSLTATVSVIADGLTEPNETFFANLTNPVNVTIADAQGVGTIVNDDFLQLLLDESGPAADQVAALDSVLFVRDPFRVQSVGWLNTGTRVVVAAANLSLTPNVPTVLVNLMDASNQSVEVQAEDVRTVPNSEFRQIIFALPQNLSAGICKVTIKASGKISNTGTIRIAP